VILLAWCLCGELAESAEVHVDGAGIGAYHLDVGGDLVEGGWMMVHCGNWRRWECVS
jgi:hypothetical protein